MLKHITPSYLAGLIDGDGSFQLQINTRETNRGVKNIRINPRVVVAFKYRDKEALVVNQIALDYGGRMYITNKGKDNAKVSWMTTNIEDCIKITEEVIDELMIKDEIAGRFLSACYKLRDFKKKRKGVNFWKGERVYSKSELIELVTISTSLNFGMQETRWRNSLGRNLDYYLKYIDDVYSN